MVEIGPTPHPEQLGRPRVHVVNGPAALCAKIERAYDLRNHHTLQTVALGFEVVLVGEEGPVLQAWLTEHPASICLRIVDTNTPIDAAFFDDIAPDVEFAALCRQLDRAHEHARLRQVEQARLQTMGHSAGLALVGTCPTAESLRRSVRLLARSVAPVLLVGELGTGKEDVSHAIHLASRSAAPFVRVSATPRHGRPRLGQKSWDLAIAQAGLGTLLIDDATELSDRTQATIGRALRDGLGCRVVFAARPGAGARFIEELGARFEADRLELPTLRVRGDVQILSQHLLENLSAALHRGPRSLAPAVKHALERYTFPGNLRELSVMIELALLVGGDEELSLADFPILARAVRQVRARRPSPKTARRGLRSIREGAARDEKTRVEAALTVAGGNVSAAARALGLSRYQLIRRLHKYGLR